MKTPIRNLILFMSIATISLQADPFNPANSGLFPPEFIMHHREAIQLTEDQMETIRDMAESAQETFPERHKALEKAMQDLTEGLQSPILNEESALQLLETVLDNERLIKRMHISLMIRINQPMHADQRAKLKELFTQQPPPTADPEHHAAMVKLHEKVQYIQKEVERRVQAGEQPHEVAEMMQNFHPLMEAGKLQEANALLDRAKDILSAN